ncbi:MAG: SMC family ATPase [Candidatus Micrarchaeaceae archaeon]
MINRIELENWKTHGSSSISFARGTNILIGHMGAGKSSVLDAISFALFGTFPSMQHRRVNISEVIRNRPEQKEAASVTLDFDFEGSSYTVKRQISINGAAKATLERNGEYLQSQPQRVTEEIEKILKVDYDLFSKAVYSEQNGLDYFLDLRPTERKKQIDELLGLDKFALAQENATSLINKIKDLAAENEKTAASFDIEKLKSQLEALVKELGQLELSRRETEEKMAEAVKRRKANDLYLSDINAKYQRRLAIEKEIAVSKGKMETLAAEIARLEASIGIDDEKELDARIGRAKSDKDRSENNLKNANEQYRKAQDLVSELSANLNSVMKKKAEKEALAKSIERQDKKALEERSAELTRSIERRKDELSRHIAMKAESSKWAAELEKHIQKCPVCERELNEQMRIKLLNDKIAASKQLEQMIGHAKELIEKEKAEYDAVSQSLRQLLITEERIKAYGDLGQDIARLESALEKEKLRSESLLKELNLASESNSRIEAEYRDLLSKKNEMAKRNAHIEERNAIAKRLESMEAELKGITVSQETIAKAQSESSSLASQIGTLSALVESNKRYEQDKKVQIKDKELEITKVNALYEDVKRKRHIIENVTRFRVSLQETQAALRAELINSINNVMQEVWPDLYPYGDYKSIMLDATPDDYVLKVKLRGNGSWQDVGAVASGGERSTGCLAMRIAFSLVLSPTLRWLILDEPTHNIDQQGLERFIRMFSEVLPRFIDQTFIITHDPILKQAHNSKIYMLKRNKDEDSQTVVDEV